MKIDLQTIDRTQFIVAEQWIAGELCFLTLPQHIGAKWTKDNLHFRSSVWNSQGELISASFQKFFNLGEHPEITPVPANLSDAVLTEKIDGSAFIVSKYKGQLIVRTRGTVDARKMEKNGHEVDQLLEKYPKIKTLADETMPDNDTWSFSLVFEWVSPLNQIVVRYEDADLYLTGMVYHEDYRLATQREVDGLADYLGVKRPQQFKFATIDEMIAAVTAFKGQEGICVYYNNGQNILKVKGAWYLALHRMKSELGSIDGVIDLYYSLGGKMNYIQFYQHLEKLADFELMGNVRGYLSKVIDARNNADKTLAHMKAFVEPLKGVARKDAAVKIIEAYGKTNKSGFAFTLLDGKELTGQQDKKLLYLSLN